MIFEINPFTVFIHVHFQALFQTARAALVSVCFVDRTTTLDRQTDRERWVRRALQLCFSQLERQGFSSHYLGGRPLQVKDRPYYYRCGGAALPCSSVAGFTREDKCFIPAPSHHIRLDYIRTVFRAALSGGRVTKLRSSRRDNSAPREGEREKKKSASYVCAFKRA